MGIKWLKNKPFPVIAIALIVMLLFDQIFASPIILQAQLAPLRVSNEDLILVLAEEDLMRMNRVDRVVTRYAQDIQKQFHKTTVSILEVAKGESPGELASLLKQVYFGNVTDYDSRNLKGVVIVGDIPLPIIDKQGNRFVSLYPYTDFVEPAYLYDLETGYFKSGQVNDFEPEIWHGVIQFESEDDYKTYFDKNHAFYEGDEDLTDFDEKIFYADPVHESKALNSSLIGNYQNFLAYMEDLAYNRITKELSNLLSGSIKEEVASLDESLGSLSTGLLSSVFDSEEGAPDIYSKNQIEKSFSRLTELFAKAIADQQAAIIGTGRYTSDDYVTPLKAAALKDEYMMNYFLLLNQMLEQRIDEIAETVQSPIQIPKGSQFSGNVQTFNAPRVTGSGGGLSVVSGPIFSTSTIDTQYFVNGGIDEDYARRIDLFSGGSNAALFNLASDDPLEFISTIETKIGNGNTRLIENGEECRLHLGGRIQTGLSKTVEVKRGEPDGTCYSPWEGRDDRATWNENPEWQCSSFYGENIRDEYRPELVETTDSSLTTHEACFAFRPLNQYVGLIRGERDLEAASVVPSARDMSFSVDGATVNFEQLFNGVEEFGQRADEWNGWSSYFMGNSTGQIFKSVRPLGGEAFEILINDKRVSIDEVRASGIRSWEAFVDNYLEEGESLNRLQLSRSLTTSDVIDSVNFTFNPISPARPIPSLVQHKNPDSDALLKAMENPSATDLPVDDVRHVTFAGPQGQVVEIRYPNIFDATSLADFRRQVVEIERTLNSLGLEDYSNTLTQLINSTEDEFVEGRTQLARASSETLSELIEWRNLNVSQKYTSTIKALLNKDEGTKVDLPTSFEIAVFNSDSSLEGFEYELFKQESLGLSPSRTSSISEEFEQAHEVQEEERRSSNSRSADYSDERIPFGRWFGYLLDDWLPSVTDIRGENTPAQRPSLGTYEETIGDYDSEISGIEIDVKAKHQTLNGTPTREIDITVLNEEGRKVVGQSEFVTLEVSGAQIVDGTDQDPNTPGVQVFVVTGENTVEIRPTQKGRVQISARLNDVSASEYLTFHEELNLNFVSSTNRTQVNSEDITLRVRMVNEAGARVEFARPSISFDNKNIFELSSQTEAEETNEYVYTLKPGTKSGRVNVSANLEGATSATREFVVEPGTPNKLFFDRAQIKVDTQDLTAKEFEVSVLDEFNNLVETTISNINVSIDDTEKVNIVGSNIDLTGGKGKVAFRVADSNAFGNAFIRVQKPGLEPAYLKLILSNSLKYSELKEFSNTALYYEIKSTKSDYKEIAPSLLLNGKTQAVATLTTGVENPAPLIYVHRTGAIETLDSASLKVVTNLDTTEISTDIFDNQDRKFTSIKINPSTLEWLAIPEDDITTSPGIFLNPVKDVVVEGQAVKYLGETIFHINSNGIPVLDSQTASVRQKDNQKFYTLEVVEQEGVIAEIIYNFESAGQVRIVPIEHPEIIYKEGITLPSSTAPKGVIFYNPNIALTKGQLPTGSSIRDDDFMNNELTGLREGDKSVLLFAAGQTVGEANIPYMSEIGVVFGDPVISLPESSNRSLSTGFGFDVGRYLGRADSDVNGILDMGDEILFGDREGNISIFDKESKNFQKNILKVPAGIKELHKVNLKGRQEDVLILTEEECVNNDSCIYLLQGSELINIKIDTDSKPRALYPADFNGDGDDDIAVLTTDKNLRLYVNKNGEIDPNGSSVASTASRLNESQNLIQDVWMSFDDGRLELNRVSRSAESSTTSAAGGRILSTTQSSPTYETYNFRTLTGSEYDNPATTDLIEQSPFISSTLYRRDKNGGALRDGDIVTYTLTLNASSGSYPNKIISVPLSSNLNLIADSLSDGYEWVRVDSDQREFLISGVNLSAGGTVQIKFDVEYRATGDEKAAIVQVVTDEDGYPADSLPDFKLQVPNADYTIYYYSQYDRATNRLSYVRLEKILPQADVSSYLPEIPDLENEAAANEYAQELEAEVSTRDSDGDGIPDSIDSLNTGLNDLASGVEDAISRFMCNGGGCIATPINIAFLVPNGVPVPVFGWGCPSVPPILAGTPAVGCSGGRFYLSPTLTGELAASLCLGSFPNARCWAVSIADLGGVCDAINAGIQDLMNAAVSAATSPLGNLVIATNGSSSSDDPIQTSSNIQVPGFPAVLTDWISAQYDEIQRKLLRLPELTIIYPSPASIAAGFKSTETENELDTEELRFDRLSDVLADIHAMPLFNVELETQIIKYPTINPEEFAKYKAHMINVYEQNKAVVERAKQQWGCYASDFETDAEVDTEIRDGDLEISASASNECISLDVNSARLFASFEANLDALEAYRDLPRNIFEAENFLADYASQLLGYVDTILDSTAGYISRNTLRLEQWQQAFIDMQDLISSLTAILDVSAAYMQSCDDCRSSRTNGGFQLLLNFFLQIPTPPVIPIPQILPDITIDISQIDAQVDIVLPKFEFVPDTIVLPNLQNFTITLPDAPPIDFTANPGKYGIGLFTAIPAPPDIGALIIDLPELPELNLPKLPELPKAPSLDGPVTDFLADIEVLLDTVSTILRIVCLLKSGILPVSESQLRTQIQEITARPLSPVLPIDTGLGFQAPNPIPEVEIDYVKELQLILETNIQFDFGLLNRAAESIAEKFNDFQTDLNQGIEQKAQQATDAAQPLDEEFVVPGTDEINDIEVDLEVFREDLARMYQDLEESGKKLNELATDQITLVATQEKVGELPRLAQINLDRDFDIPQSLENEIRKIIAFKEGNIEKIEKLNNELRLIASAELPSEGTNIESTTFQIAQAGTVGFSNSPEFNPEGGIYIHSAATGLSERVVNYSAEPNSNVKVSLQDADKDGDEDLVYARGSEIFIKDNLNTQDRITRNTARIETKKFDNLRDQIADLSTLTSGEVKVAAAYKSVTLSLPETLQEKTIVVDVYRATPSSSEKAERFVVETRQAASDFEEVSQVDLVDGPNIPRDGFEAIYRKGGYTQSLDLPLENETYQIVVMIVNPQTNKLDVINPNITATPNICNDESPPRISVAPDSKIRTAILKPVDIDLSESTDSETEIAQFYLDTDPDTDTDGDGDPTNDKILVSPDDRLISKFRLSGSNTERNFTVTAWGTDMAGNSASRRIDIEVVTPVITVDSVSEDSITGSIDPPDENVDLTVVRERDGVVTELGDVTTDEDGEFVYDDLETDGNLIISDSLGNDLFEINEETGSVIPKHSSASIDIQSARAGVSPTTILLKKNIDVITRIVRVPDSNNDVQVVNTAPSDSQLNSTTQVFVLDANPRDDFEVESIAGGAAGYAGGTQVTLDGARKVIVDVDGSIILIDPSIKLSLESIRNVSEPQWFDLRSGSSLIAKVFIGTGRGRIKYGDPAIEYSEVTVTATGEGPSTTFPGSSTADQGFADVNESDQDAEIFDYLRQTGVVEGVVRDGVRYFEPDREITRAEYSKIILNALCIVPREEAYLSPPVFDDIPYSQEFTQWYYPYTKETQLQNFFTGYLGEINPETGLAPFKPLNPITRAEAAKVILEALNTQNILDLSNIPVLEPWYLPYLQISLDLRPYLVSGDEIRQTFLLTEEEADVPLRNISRREFAIMAYRALNVQNCLEADDDNDGIPYYEDVDPTTDDSDQDSDGDGVSNGDEIDAGTDPLNPETQTPRVQTEAGIYMERIVCLSCPCLYNVEHEADLRPGDKIYVILRSSRSGTIYQASEPVIFRP